MRYTHLITAEQLQALQAGGAPLMVFDCSGERGNPAAADAMFAERRIAGSREGLPVEPRLREIDRCLTQYFVGPL